MKLKIFKLPLLGRFAVVADRHGSGTNLEGAFSFKTNLSARVFDKDGNERKIKDYFSLVTEGNIFQRIFYRLLYRNKTELNLGSGSVTNIGVLAMANEFAWANPSGSVNTILAMAKFMATGTGVTAAAATDVTLQTISTQNGQNPVTGTQTLVSAANSQKLQVVGTITYTGTEAVTEFGLFNSATLSATTGTPFTATTATSATATATPYTASSSTVAGQQLTAVFAGTTAVYGLVLSNTTSVLTIPAWYKTTDGTAGATPGSTEAFTLKAIMWDHKVFAAINVNNGDSIQFTYQLAINSGG